MIQTDTIVVFMKLAQPFILSLFIPLSIAKSYSQNHDVEEYMLAILSEKAINPLPHHASIDICTDNCYHIGL